MAAGQQADQQPIDHAALADDDLLDLAVERFEPSAHLLSVAIDLGGIGGHAENP